MSTQHNHGRGDAQQLALIPQPTQVTYADEIVPLGSQVIITWTTSTTPFTAIADTLVTLIEQIRGECDALGIPSRSSTRQYAVFEQAELDSTVIVLDIDQSRASNAYTLEITPATDQQEHDRVTTAARVRVKSGGLEGLRYGVQTLRQILRQSNGRVPCMFVDDKPAFALRGYSLDVTRGRVPTLAFLMWFADQLAYYKYNQLQLYVEHTFAFDELAEAWRGSDPLTADDIVQFDEYCARLGIELVPSLATFGHMYMNLRTRSHRELGEFPEQADRPFGFIERMEHHTLNAADPQALAFAQRLIGEYASLYRSRLFNIGGDETFDLGRGQSATVGAMSGKSALYARFVAGLCDPLEGMGRRPMLWADIALESPDVLDLLPDDVIMLNWMYEPEIDEERIVRIARTGRTQIVCPAVRAWSRFLPDYEGAWLNILHMAQAGLHYGAYGLLVTDWGDYGAINDPRMSAPAMCYGAQQAWNPGSVEFEDMNCRVSTLALPTLSTAHGSSTGSESREHVCSCTLSTDLMSVLCEASQCVSFPWDLAVQWLELDAGNGMINDDVADYVERSHAGTVSLERGVGCALARRRLLEAHAEKIESWQDANRRLQCCEYGLTGDLAFIRVLIDGQRLFNQLGAMLLAMPSGNGIDHDNPMKIAALQAERDQLAAQLESWLTAYRTTWLEIGRYAEFDRIRHVIWSFSDILRAGSY